MWRAGQADAAIDDRCALLFEEQASKTIQYQWLDNKVCPTCVPGDKKYEPGEEGAVQSSALAGAISVDPGVGCAQAIIKGWLTGSEPSCGCG